MTQGISIFSVPRPARLTETVRARLRPPDIEAEEVGAVLRQYGLEPVGPPGNLSASRRNHNVTVATPAGKKLLKRYRPQWRPETVAYAHSILGRLSEVGFPVPGLAAALDGESFVNREGRLYALMAFVDGSGYSGRFLLRHDRRRLMGLAGATMARLHGALRGFTPVGSHHLGFSDYAGPRRRDVAWHRDRVAELRERSLRLGRPEEQPHASWLAQHGEAILAQLGALDAQLADAPLMRTVIHGDYGLHNLLFQKDGTVTPVDFELARLEWRLSDLVSCLSRFRYAEGPYDFESIGWFVAAYDAELPLSDDEWRLFPLVWRFYKLQGAVQYWSSYFETGGPARKLAAARDAAEQAAWAAGRQEYLRVQLRGFAG
jgi:Ser/Thr protein kinase RdoA (MazF antagonist)